MAPAIQAENSEGEQLLKSMQSAIHSLNYAGELVFWKGNEMSEYHIEHQSGQGGNSESVIQLGTANGNAAQQKQQFSLVNSSSMNLPAQQVYSIDVGQGDVIAGLPCKVVVIRPKDKMRYLYRYCIHPDSGMLLKYSVMNREQQLLEQFMFTQLEIDPSGGSEVQETQQIQPMGMSLAESDVSMASVMMGEETVNQWDLSQLPAGFSVHQVRMLPEKENVHQIILSDGLTYVSVFIEPDNQNGGHQYRTHASGATNILTARMAGHIITMVGEVPNETLETIKKGLRYVAP